MSRSKLPVALLGTVVLLGGCTFADETLFPALTGEEAAETPAQVVEIPAARAEANQLPTLAAVPATTSDGFIETGTAVGERVARLRGDLARLQGSTAVHNQDLAQFQVDSVENAQRYNTLIANIQARLQVGTTPGNPILVRQWNEAQGVLEKVGSDIGRLNNLSSGVADDGALAAFILESTRATFGLTGAVDEDHRQLALLEDDVNRTVVQIDRLLNELNDDVTRQSNYMSRERSNLTILSLAVKNGEIFGSSLANRAFASAAPAASQPPSPVGSAARTRPLVVIRFDRPNVEYEQPLFTALSEALQRRPEATFELVGVTPERGTPAQVALNASAARRNTQGVLRALTSMGLPRNRVDLSATTSGEAQTSEVHVYVR